MPPTAFATVLSGDLQQIEQALQATGLSVFIDRPSELAEIVADATSDDAFPRLYRESQSLFLADAIIARHRHVNSIPQASV
jgi:hypothetical protein